MKLNKIQIFSLTAAVAFVSYCAASDYSSPGDVTKTGVNTTSGIYYDTSKLSISSYSTPTSFTACTTANDFNTKVLVSSAGVLSPNTQSITAQTGAGSTGVTCAEAQAVAYVPNANDNVWKWVMAGTITIGTSQIATQSITLTRAFSADLDKDGVATDAILYNVTLSGSGNVLVSRNAKLSSVGSCVTSRTVPCAAATSASSNTTIAAAALSTAGDHTFSITWQTQTGTSNAGGNVVVVIDGTTIFNGTSNGLENPGANLANGAAEPATSGILVSGTTASTWAVLNSSAVPVNALNIVMKGGTQTAGAQTTASVYPSLKSFTVSK